jgi:hypothetical protein
MTTKKIKTVLILSAGDAQELETLKTKLFSVEEELRDKSRKLEQLQSKFADREKEYMVPYRQQQNQLG